jgi:uncharacterized phosphosugar-binding protein
MMNGYINLVLQKLKDAAETQEENIEKAAELVVQSFVNKRNFFTFGTGHSHMIAEELYLRAGGLAFVRAMLPPELMLHEMARKSTFLERLPGYAAVLLRLYGLGQGDTILIISNSGRNSVPVEMALEARAAGASVIALSSLKHSRRVRSRHTSGRRLFEAADVVLDNQAEYGDAAYVVEGCAVPAGPTSDAVGIALVQALAVQITEKLVRRGIEPPLLRSSNAGDADAYNDKLIEQFFGPRAWKPA